MSGKIDATSVAIGGVVGFLLGSALKPVGAIAILYSSVIFLVRCAIAFRINIASPRELSYVYSDMSRTKYEILDVSSDYNIFSNTVTITRSMGTVMKTDKDTIKTVVRKMFGIFLFWDIFNHICPVNVVFN